MKVGLQVEQATDLGEPWVVPLLPGRPWQCQGGGALFAQSSGDFAGAVVFAEVEIGAMVQQLPDRLGAPPTCGCAQRCAHRAGAAAFGVWAGADFYECLSEIPAC